MGLEGCQTRDLVSLLQRSSVSLEKAERFPGCSGKTSGLPPFSKMVLSDCTPLSLTKKFSIFKLYSLLGGVGSEQWFSAKASTSATSDLNPDSAPSKLCHP